MTLLQLRLRLPSHVAVPLLFVCGAGTVSLPKLLKIPPLARLTRVDLALGSISAIFVAAFCWAALSTGLPGVLSTEAREQVQTRDAANLASVLELVGEDGAAIIVRAQVGFVSVHPLRGVEQSGIRTITLGWNSRTPDFTAFLERSRLRDIDEAILSRRDLAIVATEEEAAIYSSFVAEHYDTVGALWPVGSLEASTIGIYSGFATGSIGDAALEIKRGGIVEEYAIGLPSPGSLLPPEIRPRITGIVRGWIGDPSGAPSDFVLVFIDGRLVAATAESLTLAGAPPERSFFIDMPSALLVSDAEVRVFGVWGSEARELAQTE